MCYIFFFYHCHWETANTLLCAQEGVFLFVVCVPVASVDPGIHKESPCAPTCLMQMASSENTLADTHKPIFSMYK